MVDQGDSLAGFDIVTGEDLSPGERAFAGAAALVGLLTLGIGSSVLRGGTRTASRLNRMFDGARNARRLTGNESAFVDDLLRRLKEEAIGTRGRGARQLRNNCEVVSELFPNRAGRRLAIDSCLVLGTLVAVPGASPVAIEAIQTGWAVLSCPPFAQSSAIANVNARQVLSSSNVSASAITEIRLISGSEYETLRLTPEHKVATCSGFVDAKSLVPGMRLLNRQNLEVQVANVDS